MQKSIAFFESQFQKQAAANASALNPFEAIALPYLHGRVLDFGCGMGNLAVAAARRGCTVLALDAAPTAISHLAARAVLEGLAIEAIEADLSVYEIAEDFDAVVTIGLLMFLDRATAREQLRQLQSCVCPGGIAAVNVLIEGTTYLDMFDPVAHCLFRRGELTEAFAGWDILNETFDDFPAPENTVKRFVTLIARKTVTTSP